MLYVNIPVSPIELSVFYDITMCNTTTAVKVMSTVLVVLKEIVDKLNRVFAKGFRHDKGNRHSVAVKLTLNSMLFEFVQHKYCIAFTG
jgi:hypothetical protein